MDFTTSVDQELISRARDGDDAAFAQLVTRYTPALYRVVRRMASDQAEAEAIVQESFLRIWQNLHRYQADRPFFPYLVTIAVNLGRDQWRKSRFLDFGGLESVADSLPSPELDPEIQVERAEMLQTLAQAVANLPPAYRAVIALRYDASLSYQQIADALNLPLNTVRTHLRRAKGHLRKVLELLEE